jgi:imidazolonepropionase
MSNPILIRGARQLITVSGAAGPRRGAQMQELHIIPDGAVLIQEGRISDIGPSRRVERLTAARKAEEIDATGQVVLPGFVDCHTSLMSGPPRLDEYSAPAKSDASAAALRASVRTVRNYSTQRMELETRRHVRQFVRHGVTTLGSMTGYGLDETTELRSLRILKALDERPLAIVGTYFGAHGCPAEYSGRAGDYIDWMRERMLPLIQKRRLAGSVAAEMGPHAFGAELCLQFLTQAAEAGFQVRVVAGAGAGDEAVMTALEAGAVSIERLGRPGPEAIRALAGSDTLACLVPGECFHRGEREYPHARDLIDENVAVAVASGFDSSTSPTCSMPAVLSIACSQMGMRPAEAIIAGTINGAHVLGVAERAGSIEYGKDADLVVMHVPDYREIPFHFGMNPVAMVMRRGQRIWPVLETV